MNEFGIHIEPRSFRKTSAGTAIGVIAMNFGNFWFPEENWTDFVVRILGSWLNSLQHLPANEKSNLRLQFMDGPYEVVLLPQPNDQFTIEFVKRGISRTHVVLSGAISFADLISEVTNAGRIVLDACVEMGIIGDDVTFLKSTLEQFNRKMAP